ncbi:MAG: CDP-archaeol synthase [Thiotrichales bacterium]|nr:CDP-archaeol synthase [Thiotrichales bacterium]
MIVSSLFSDWSNLAAILALLISANAAPILATKLLPTVGACPIDNGVTFIDRKPLLGESKTVRGLFAALIITSVVAPIVGLPVAIGLTVAVGAMIGDLMSSFIKRRLGVAASGKAPGLDQIPESLIPLLFIQSQMNFGIYDIVLLLILFVVLEMVLSRIFFRWRIRR